MARIIIVDDDAGVRTTMAKFVADEGHEMVEARDGTEALRLYREKPADLVIADVYMPGADGIEVTIRLRHEFPEAKIVVISGGGYRGSDEVLRAAAKIGAERTLERHS